MPVIGDQLDARLRDTVAMFRAQRRIPGIVAGVVIGDELAWTHHAGLADLATGRPIEIGSLFRIASITKTFVATAILQLRDEGRLTLDDPLVRHVPEFAQATNPFGPIEAVTLRGLLTHTSGLQYAAAYDDPALAIRGFCSREDMLSTVRQVRVVIPPGRWKYSNLAYELLGEVIRRLGRDSLSGYFRANILAPLGMDSTTFDPQRGLEARCAVGHRSTSYEDRVPGAVTWQNRWDRAAGGLWSCVDDMARWIGAQFKTGPDVRRGNPGVVLDGPSATELHRPTVLKDDTWSYAQGLGWAGLRRGELAVTSHSGGLPGWRANVLFHGTRRFGVIVLLNAHNDAPGLGLDLAEVIAPVARGAGAIEEPASRLERAPEHVREYLGTYVRRDQASSIRVEYRSRALVTVGNDVFSRPGSFDVDELLPTGRADRFYMPDGVCPGEEAWFERDEAGRITRFVLGGADHYRLDPVEQGALD